MAGTLERGKIHPGAGLGLFFGRFFGSPITRSDELYNGSQAKVAYGTFRTKLKRRQEFHLGRIGLGSNSRQGIYLHLFSQNSNLFTISAVVTKIQILPLSWRRNGCQFISGRRRRITLPARSAILGQTSDVTGDWMTSLRQCRTKRSVNIDVDEDRRTPIRHHSLILLSSTKSALVGCETSNY